MIKPFIDQMLSPEVPVEERHLYHLPRTCWNRKRTGKPIILERPTGILIHKNSGMYAFPDDPFDPEKIDRKILVPYRASYNVMVHRDATAVGRVPEGFGAFHAGLSRWEDQEYCNYFTLGLALVSKGKTDQDGVAFEPDMISKAIEVCVYWIRRYKMDHARITSHEHTRNDWNNHNPNRQGESRRGDPGDFPWADFRNRIAERLLDG
jgi:N-acetylmuramoyl-L-alanine amidase